MRILSLSSLTCVLGVMLGGCATQSDPFSDMQAEIDARLAEGVTTSEQTSIDAPDLSEGFSAALRSATQSDASYRASLAFEQEAASGVGVAQSALSPQFTGGATIGGLRELDPVNETSSGAAANITVSQLIYDGGVSQATISRATALALVARAERAERGNSVALDAARAWIDLWQASERLALLDRKTSGLSDIMGQIDRMAANGMMNRASVEGARRQILDIRLERESLQALVADAQIRFARYFGVSTDTVAQPEFVVSPAIAAERSQEWRSAPSLQKAAAEILAARGTQSEARAAFQPTVSLQAGVRSPLDAADSTDLNAGFQVQYVFGDGGRRAERLEAATSRVEALEAQLEATMAAERTASDASLRRLDSVDQTLVLLDEKVALTASQASVAESQIATGQASLQLLIGAKIENYRALDRQIQLRAEKHVLLLSIAGQLGFLTDVIELRP
ncbi:MAG: TolC family protein [Octadecabacter sp.]